MGISLNGVLDRPRVGWSTRIEPRWTFDLDAIGRAARELGVTGLLEVGCAEYANGRWGGMYSHERGVHKVRVRRASSPAEASRTLWHELTHAAQHSRGDEPGERGMSSSAQSRLSPAAYNRLPGEAEAHANEANHERMALTRPR